MSGEFKVVAFDVDGTLIQGGLWARMNDLMKLDKGKDGVWFQQYLEGKLTFRDWLSHMSSIWVQNTQPREALEAICRDFQFMPNAEHLIHHLRGRYAIALISSGLDLYVNAVAERLGVEHVYCYTKTLFDEKGLFKEIAFTTSETEHQAKVDGIKDLQNIYSATPEEVLFVGDSVNDLQAFEYTKRGVLYKEGNESLRASAWKQVSDLKEIENFL